MKISCIHCGQEFSIHAADLGGVGKCPHCLGQISLPKAATAESEQRRGKRQRPAGWLDGSISGLLSLVLHMALFLAVVLLQQEGGSGGAGEGDEVLIGLLPTEELVERAEWQISTQEVARQQSSDLNSLVEVDVPSPATTAASGGGDLAAGAISAGGADSGSFDLGTVQIGGAGGSVGGGSFEGMVGQLRKTGLDIVICFDSTGSMSGEINQVKQQIERIGQSLMTLVPKARISICTFRDQGDEYVVKGLPLSNSIQDVSSYLGRIEAGGGGDHPEAVEEGLNWSSGQNHFRPGSRKVILLFGDAPPHQEKLKRCLEIAADFKQQHKGTISTVTCRNDQPLPEFYQIATAGGGEAFLTADQKQIMTQLMVLVFGSQHRQKVIEAFKLLER